MIANNALQRQEGTLRILTWNLCHPDLRTSALIVDYLRAAHGGVDVLALTEYAPLYSPDLPARLVDAGWEHVVVAADAGRAYGVLVAARTPLRATGHTLAFDAGRIPESEHDRLARRWLEVELSAWQGQQMDRPLVLDAVHVPDDDLNNPVKGLIKRAFWDAVLERLAEIGTEPAILTGDLNTGLPADIVDIALGQPLEARRARRRGTAYTYPEAILCLRDQLGWIDAWRRLHPDRYEYTWKRKNGFRLDQTWLSPVLASSLRSATHVDEAADRVSIGHSEKPRSDHAALIVEIAAVRGVPVTEAWHAPDGATWDRSKAEVGPSKGEVRV